MKRVGRLAVSTRLDGQLWVSAQMGTSVACHSQTVCFREEELLFMLLGSPERVEEEHNEKAMDR
jgi:hypothetical protein